MNASEIIGVALYANSSQEIEHVIEQHLDTLDQDIFAACVHGVGHLARRFRVDVSVMQEKISSRAEKFKDSKFVMGALEDMSADIEHFCN